MKQVARSAHIDTFTRENLPPLQEWPEFLFTLPELAYPPALNCAEELLDRGPGEHALRRGRDVALGKLRPIARGCLHRQGDVRRQPAATTPVTTRVRNTGSVVASAGVDLRLEQRGSPYAPDRVWSHRATAKSVRGPAPNRGCRSQTRRTAEAGSTDSSVHRVRERIPRLRPRRENG